MARYLTIDIGNSSTKMLAWADGEAMGKSVHGRITPADVQHLCAQTGGRFDCAAVCSVAPDTRGLAAEAARCSDRVIEVSAATPLPISLGVYSAGTLGADRIAALAGARGLCPEGPVLVIDCGTAVTYDLLGADNVFAGGNIAPGLGMRLKAMHAFTARLPELSTRVPEHRWGRCTAEAMTNGAFYGVVAEIEHYRRHVPAATRTVLTGGRAKNLIRHLSFEAQLDPDLVLRGLRDIIVYNMQDRDPGPRPAPGTETK